MHALINAAGDACIGLAFYQSTNAFHRLNVFSQRRGERCPRRGPWLRRT